MAMIVAGFSGAEAEELRKAVGMRRTKQRMEQLVIKLRHGMASNAIPAETQDMIVQSIQSFALYGFPESHAASFALLAYASAYFKVKYLAAFTCAMLNNQPMGFYMPAVLVKDAQRHHLRICAINVQCSQTHCTIEHQTDGSLAVRLGLRYVKGLRTQTADAITLERQCRGPFLSTEDLALRVPQINRKELRELAHVGALNWIDGVAHRRDALWQTEQIGRSAGPLLTSASHAHTATPLRQMSTEDRLVADYAGTGLTVDHHPLYYRRAELRQQGILAASDLAFVANGALIVAAGCVIARQRPGTAMGFIFLSMEDETGIANVIVHPELYDSDRVTVTRSKFLRVTGRLQNQDGVLHIRATAIEPLQMQTMDLHSHDFH